MLKKRLQISPEGGFTFIELLITLVLISIGLFSSISVLNTTLENNNNNDKKTKAVNLASEKLEDLKNQAISSALSSGTTTENNVNEQGISGSGPFTRTSVITDGGTSSLTTLTVTVSWTNKTARSVILSTKLDQS
jgi:prepilin-type N-terminal cleavage/methylation domain-containing protein